MRRSVARDDAPAPSGLGKAGSVKNCCKHARPSDLHTCHGCERDIPFDPQLHACHLVAGPPLKRIKTGHDTYVLTQVPISLLFYFVDPPTSFSFWTLRGSLPDTSVNRPTIFRFGTLGGSLGGTFMVDVEDQNRSDLFSLEVCKVYVL